MCLVPELGIRHKLSSVASSDFDCRAKDDGFYPSPDTCSTYYICAAQQTYRSECRLGMLFDDETLFCDYPGKVTCHAKASQKPTVTTTRSSIASKLHFVYTLYLFMISTRFYSCLYNEVFYICYLNHYKYKNTNPVTFICLAFGSSVEFCTGKIDGFYRDPVNCSAYYQCSFGSSYHKTCPYGTLFSETLEGCDWAEKVPDCSLKSVSEFSCKDKYNGFYEDPDTCSFYYQCSFGVTYHSRCPTGTVFNESLQGCDWPANGSNCP